MTVEVYVLWWLRAPSIQHFSGFPSVAPEPSELTLTINNHVCSTAYILATVHQHSWDVWAVPCVAPAESACRSAVGEPGHLRCMSLTESLRLRERLSARPQETVSLIIFYQLNPFMANPPPPPFKLPSACRPPYARNEKNPACKFSSVYVHIMLRASLIHGCFLIAAHLDVLREVYEQV